VPDREPRAMIYKYCACGHAIGVQESHDSRTFYDDFDWQKPIEVCPSCQEPIDAGKLEFSEEQARALGRAYRLILNYASKRRSDADHP